MRSALIGEVIRICPSQLEESDTVDLDSRPQDLATRLEERALWQPGNFCPTAEMRLEIGRQSLYQPLTKRGRPFSCST